MSFERLEMNVNDLVHLVAGMAGSWDFVLCIWSNSCAFSAFYILHCTGDQRAHTRGNRGQMFIDFEVVDHCKLWYLQENGMPLVYSTLSTLCYLQPNK